MSSMKFILWREEFSLEAYMDQMGVSHSGYIVLEQIPVTIIETKIVKGTWRGGDCEGWKAVSETGEEFTCNWNTFPDDSMTPTFYWDARKDSRGLWKPVDGIQAYNFKIGVYCNPDGSKCIPLNAKICEKHKEAFLEGDTCWKCDANI